MEHVAILKKSWGFTKKILDGRKTVESRWYTTKKAPWGCIKEGDIVYFKDSGEPVTIKTTVAKVERYENLNEQKVKDLLKIIHKAVGIDDREVDNYAQLFRKKKYCILIHLKNPLGVAPFNINKKGFGLMYAWISVDNVDRIKVPAV
ncbi:MAG: hypothetical protein M1465_03485 [Candidatus Marsarchaeota archaeon]|nr:hypothetical protein [Candidatus Marsarchaeota archaeon]